MKKTIVCLLCMSLMGCQSFTTPNYSTNEKEEAVTSEVISTNQGTEIISGLVVDVTDGNQFRVKVTEDVLLDGINLRQGDLIVVRMLMSQAPSRIEGLPFGEEAYGFLYDLIMGESVELEFESGNVLDTMGNYNAYTYLDGHRVQDVMIENGFAMVQELGSSSVYLDEFKQLEETAKSSAAGIWAIPNYASVQEGFNQFIMESSNITKEQLDALENDLTTNGNTIKDNLFKIIGTDAPK